MNMPVNRARGTEGDNNGGGRVCPFCRTDTAIADGPALAFDKLKLDEFDTMVRNEWRRRLGPPSYHRRHAESFIRALALATLAPDNDRLRPAVETALWEEVAEMRSEGRARSEIQHELRELVMSMRSVLKRAAVPWQRILVVTEPAHHLLNDLLGWPGALDVSDRQDDA